MDWLLVAFIALGAFLAGEFTGYRNGVIIGRAEEHVRQRIARLQR